MRRWIETAKIEQKGTNYQVSTITSREQLWVQAGNGIDVKVNMNNMRKYRNYPPKFVVTVITFNWSRKYVVHVRPV